MDLGLGGKRVLITGASQGIGEGIAEVFAEEGAVLHLTARSADKLEAIAARLRTAHGADVTIHPLDLTGGEAPARLAGFVAAGMHGQMAWMAERMDWRANPAALTIAVTSARSTDAPAAGTMNAQMASPVRLLGIETTATSSISDEENSTSSISRALIFSPARMIRSFFRSTMV